MFREREQLTLPIDFGHERLERLRQPFRRAALGDDDSRTRSPPLSHPSSDRGCRVTTLVGPAIACGLEPRASRSSMPSADSRPAAVADLLSIVISCAGLVRPT